MSETSAFMVAWELVRLSTRLFRKNLRLMVLFIPVGLVSLANGLWRNAHPEPKGLKIQASIEALFHSWPSFVFSTGFSALRIACFAGAVFYCLRRLHQQRCSLGEASKFTLSRLPLTLGLGLGLASIAVVLTGSTILLPPVPRESGSTLWVAYWFRSWATCRSWPLRP